MRQEKIIAALDLGSSKLTGVLGIVSADRTFTVIAATKEEANSTIKRGCVHNIEEASVKIGRIFGELEKQAEAQHLVINKAYVSLNGQSIHSVRRSFAKTFLSEEMITERHLKEIEEETRRGDFGEYEPIMVIPSEYRLDGLIEQRPTGLQCRKIEANLLVIVGRSSIKRNITRCFDRIKMPIAGFIIPSLSMSHLLLTSEEKQLGCLLIDFGAAITTMSIFKKGELQYLVTIPFGGSNITKDIASLNILESQAEVIKKIYANALAEQTGDNNQLSECKSIVEGIEVYPQELNMIAEARVEEILENILNQVRESGFLGQLPGGVIVTGGASLLNGLTDALQKKLQMKIKKGGILCAVSNKTQEPINEPANYSVLSLVMTGSETCAEEIRIFEPEPISQPITQPVVPAIENQPLRDNKAAHESKEPPKPTKERLIDFLKKMAGDTGVEMS